MRILLYSTLLLFTLFVISSCKNEQEVEIPSAKTTIFIDLEGIQFSDINKEVSPTLDLIVRSGTEILIENPELLKGYQLLNLSPDSSFIKTTEIYLRTNPQYFVAKNSDSLNIFEDAANIFSEQKPMFIYLDAKLNNDSLQNFDKDFQILIDRINYSSKFDKTLIVLMFNGSNNKGLKILVNGPKVRKGAEVEGTAKAIDLNTSILSSMDILVPKDWPGKIIKYLFLEEHRD